MNKWVRLLVVAVASSGLVAACGDGASGDDPPGAEGADGGVPAEVVIVQKGDVDSLDPALGSSNEGDQQVWFAVYSQLVHRRLDGEIVPFLASSWTSTPTSTTFELRDGAICPDGQPLTADDVAESFRRLGDPDTGALLASRVFGSGGLDEITVDGTSITITLNEPYSGLVNGMALPSSSVVCPAGLSDPDSLTNAASGTGAYELADVVRGDHYTLERRPDGYVLPEGVTDDDLPEQIVVRITESASTAANLLLSGEADIAPVLGQDATRLDGDPAFERVDSPAYGVDGLLFNQAEGLPGADPAVRRAIATAIDREAYTTAATFGLGTPMPTIYTPNIPCYDEGAADAGPSVDLDEAADLLAEAGYGPDNPLRLRMLGNQTQNGGPEYLQSTLNELPGVEVELTNGTFQQMFQNAISRAWDILVAPFTDSFPHPSLYVAQLSGDPATSFNLGLIHNATYEEEAAAAVAAEDEDDACAAWQRAERAILENVDTVPLVQKSVPYFANGLDFEADYYYVDIYTIQASSE